MQEFRFPTPVYHRASLEFSPDGRFLGAYAKTYTMLDTQTGELATPLTGPYRTWAARFVPGRRAFVYLGQWMRVVFHDLDTGDTKEWKVERSPADVVVHPDGETAYVSFYDYSTSTGEIRAVRIADMTPTAVLVSLKGRLGELAVSADGKWLASNAGKVLRAWPLGGETVPDRAKVKGEPGAQATGFGLTHDGAVLACAATRAVFAWDTRNGTPLFQSGRHARNVTAVACAPDRPLIATGDSGGRVFFWDARGNVLKSFAWDLGALLGLAFAPDGQRCAALDRKGKVVIWDVDA